MCDSGDSASWNLPKSLPLAVWLTALLPSSRTISSASSAHGCRSRSPGSSGGRLRDAHHAAGAVLLLLGAPDGVVDAITGREPGGAARMRAGYMRVTGPILRRAADQVGEKPWGPSVAP